MIIKLTWFQISVHHPIGMAVLNTFKDLLDAERGIRLAVKLSGYNVLKQFPSGDQVKHKVVEVLLL